MIGVGDWLGGIIRPSRSNVGMTQGRGLSRVLASLRRSQDATTSADPARASSTTVSRTDVPSGSDDHERDRALMRQVCNREEAALTTLYDRYASVVNGLATSILRDPALAEEATHDVFLRLWLQPTAYDLGARHLRRMAAPCRTEPVDRPSATAPGRHGKRARGGCRHVARRIPTEGDAVPGADVPEASPMAFPAATPVAAGDTTIVTSEDSELGTIFTDPEGMVLYIFLTDVPGSGESTCYDQCEENWPVFSADEPLTLPDGVSGELGTIERTDGTTQVTYNGWPLYYWIQDQAPGDATGQGVGDVWYVAIPVEGDETPGADVPAS